MSSPQKNIESRPLTRRTFVRGTGAVLAASALSFPRHVHAAGNDTLKVALIGCGGRGAGAAAQALSTSGSVKLWAMADLFADKLDINGTPDHWHTAVNIAACRAGKDVYTEKPLTLTIEEGKILRRVVRETGRIVQVGTQQRSAAHFRTACELVRNGRVGKLRQVAVLLPFYSYKGGPFATQPIPPKLDWDLFQGQAPERPYLRERTHFSFRFWFDYAGGHMGNFFECVASRKQPISTVDVAHRVITACHLGNASMQLKRAIRWDPEKEEVVGDAEASQSIYVRREQRKPYRIEA